MFFLFAFCKLWKRVLYIWNSWTCDNILVSIVGADALVLKHQAISIHDTDSVLVLIIPEQFRKNAPLLLMAIIRQCIGSNFNFDEKFAHFFFRALALINSSVPQSSSQVFTFFFTNPLILDANMYRNVVLFQLFASGLMQFGKSDTEGLLGFLPRDIMKEFRRARRLVG